MRKATKNDPSAQGAHIAVNSIWEECDKRTAGRLVRVIADARDKNNIVKSPDFEDALVRIGSIAIITIDARGNRVGRIQFAKPERFSGRAGGYKRLEGTVLDAETPR